MLNDNLKSILDDAASEYGYDVRINLSRIDDYRQIEGQLISAVRTTLICHGGCLVDLIFYENAEGVARQSIELGHGGIVARDDLQVSMTLIPQGDVAGTTVRQTVVVSWIDRMVRDTNPLPLPRKRLSRLMRRYWPLAFDTDRQRNHERRNLLRNHKLGELRHQRKWRNSDTLLNNSTTGTVLFALYWADIGGAEAFAVECIRTAKLAGHRVIVCTDECSRRNLLDKINIYADAIYSLGDFGTAITKDKMAWSIIHRENPDRIHIHHSWIFYRLLPHIRAMWPQCRIMDTTHIFEHSRHDFVMESAQFSDFIDCHHVISRQLQDTYVDRFGINKGKVAFAPLTAMSRNIVGNPDKWGNVDTLKVAFVGRMTQQKRPYVFVQMARDLVRKFGPRFEFTAIGNGELRQEAERMVAKFGLSGNFQFLPGSANVEDVLREAHIVVMPSENEGLALVAIEAVRADCVVLSCDVGAQREVVADAALLPRFPYPAVNRGVAVVGALLAGRLNYRTVLSEQNDKLATLDAAPGAIDLVAEFYG